MEKVRYHM